MAKHDTVNIPTIRGRIAERLQRAAARGDEDELDFGESVGDVMLRTPAERGTVALACLILENLRDAGGTKTPGRPLEAVLKKTLATLGPKAIMDIEIEAYELLLWIGKAIDPEWEHEAVIDVDAIDPRAGHVQLVQYAIAHGHDLELDYFGRNRGEPTHRRITPISFEAETYLHAYCHLRRDERIFRISRIAELKPVGGWSRIKRATPKKASEPEDTGQTSLL